VRPRPKRSLSRGSIWGPIPLLYAQPLTRIAQLRTSDITTADSGEIAITVARGAIVLPEPLASIALAPRNGPRHRRHLQRLRCPADCA
jgi:hypothetical protein